MQTSLTGQPKTDQNLQTVKLALERLKRIAQHLMGMGMSTESAPTKGVVKEEPALPLADDIQLIACGKFRREAL